MTRSVTSKEYEHLNSIQTHLKDTYIPTLKQHKDLPGGPGVKNPACSAGGVGLIPGWGTKSPHATGQVSPWAQTTKTQCSQTNKT